MGDSELHDCQPPPADSIGQVWTCLICGDPWRAEEGAPIGWRCLRMGSEWHRCEVEAAEHDDLAPWPLILQRAKGGVRTNMPSSGQEGAREPRCSEPCVIRPFVVYVERNWPHILTSARRIHEVRWRDAGARMDGYGHGSRRDLVPT